LNEFRPPGCRALLATPAGAPNAVDHAGFTGIVLQPFVISVYQTAAPVCALSALAVGCAGFGGFYWSVGYFNLALSVLCPRMQAGWFTAQRCAPTRGLVCTLWATLAVVSVCGHEHFCVFRSFLYGALYRGPLASRTRPWRPGGNRIVVRKLGFGHYGSLGINLRLAGMDLIAAYAAFGEVYVIFAFPQLQVA